MNDGHLALACHDRTELEPELDTLVRALESHGFSVEKAKPGTISKDGHIRLPLLRLKGEEAEAARMGELIVDFYNSDVPVDTTLRVDDDQAVDDHLEFEIEFMGAETLVMLPPELFSDRQREQILARYHRELAKFARFLMAASRAANAA